MSPALSAHQLTYGSSVSRSYTRSAVESVSAHQLMSPGDFCSKSAVDKDSDGAAEDSKQQTAGRDAANSPGMQCFNGRTTLKKGFNVLLES